MKTVQTSPMKEEACRLVYTKTYDKEIFTIYKGGQTVCVVESSLVPSHNAKIYRIQEPGETQDHSVIATFKEYVVKVFGEDAWQSFYTHMVEGQKGARFTLAEFAAILGSDRMTVRDRFIKTAYKMGILMTKHTGWAFRSDRTTNMQDEMRAYFRVRERNILCRGCRTILNQEDRNLVAAHEQLQIGGEPGMLDKVQALKEEMVAIELQAIEQSIEEQKEQTKSRRLENQRNRRAVAKKGGS